jgi:glyoxylase-like metal-dependent hydrolase (beta-lactamase superfamily II)
MSICSIESDIAYPGPTNQNDGMRGEMQIGDIQVDAVLDVVARPMRPTTRLIKGPLGMDPPTDAEYEAMWAEYPGFLNPEGRIEIPVGCFLIRSGDRVLLVDAGTGVSHEHPDDDTPPHSDSAPHDDGLLLENLRTLGVSPADITDVVFTHLHFDHVGWASQDGQIVFPNATFRCDSRDWSHFVDPFYLATGKHDPRVTDKILPIEHRLEPFRGSGPLMPGVDAMAAPGHTPGSTVIVVSSGNERAMLLGDAVHCPVELLDDDWQGLADVDRELAMRTRVAIAKELEDSNIHVSAAHFPNLEFGRLLRGSGRRMWSVGNG